MPSNSTLIAILLLVLNASSAFAEDYRFEGDFIESHLVDGPSFMKTIPPGTKLNCGRYQCVKRYVRVFTFKNKGGTKTFWSSNTKDVHNYMASFPRHNDEGNIVYYDDTNQMMTLSHVSIEEDMKMSERLTHSVAPTHKQLVEMGDENEAIHQKDLDRRLELETEKYNRQ